MATFTKDSKDGVSEKFTPQSSFLELVSYDQKSKTMTVTFKEGNQRRYTDVTYGTFSAFKQAKSHGVYYSKVIKGSGSVSVVSHNVSTKHATQPLNKQSGAKTYGSNALSRNVRAAARGNTPTSFGKSQGPVKPSA